MFEMDEIQHDSIMKTRDLVGYITDIHQLKMIWIDFWLVVWNIFCSIYWEFHDPTDELTPSFFRGPGLNHQPEILYIIH